MRTLTVMNRLSLLMLAAVLAAPANAALNAYAELTANAEPLDGTVTVTSLGGEDLATNHIEIYEYSQTAEIKPKQRGAVAGPIVLLKRQDATSPKFFEALFEAQVIEGTIKFFGNDPDTGDTRLESTLAILGGRVTSVEQRLPDAFNQANASRPTLDIIKIVAESLTWTVR